MKIACSACLLGHKCKYNGQDNASEALLSLADEHTLIPVCPEVLGGLPTPRTPCEIVGDRIINAEGEDKTENFAAGARAALEIVKREGCQMAVLQPRSPSCGCTQIYDGTFSSTLKEGQGVFARMLCEEGIPVVDVDRFSNCH